MANPNLETPLRQIISRELSVQLNTIWIRESERAAARRGLYNGMKVNLSRAGCAFLHCIGISVVQSSRFFPPSRRSLIPFIAHRPASTVILCISQRLLFLLSASKSLPKDGLTLILPTFCSFQHPLYKVRTYHWSLQGSG